MAAVVVDKVRRALAGAHAVGPVHVAPVRRAAALVHAGGKAPSRAGEDNGAHLRIGDGIVERRAELVQHRPGRRVHRRRTIERDQHALTLLVIENLVAVGHSVYFFCSARMKPLSSIFFINIGSTMGFGSVCFACGYCSANISSATFTDWRVGWGASSKVARLCW